VLILVVLACGREAGEVAPKVEAPRSASPVVAWVGGEPIRVEDVVGRSGQWRGKQDPRRRVEDGIGARLAVQEARRRELDESPRVSERIAAIRREAVEREEDALRNALFDTLRDGIELTEEELRQHYQDTKARYFERQIHLRRLGLDSEEAARAVDAALGPAGRLDPAASEDLGPAVLRDLPPSVLPEALKLKAPGDRVVLGKEGEWALVELVEVLPTVPQPFEQARDRVEASLRTLRTQAALRELVERLRAEADIEIDESVIADEALWKRSAKAE
jgi:ribosome assembly protein YihI (activator of Der GTPase)